MSDNAAASVANSYEGPYNAEDQADIDQIATEAYDTALPGEWSDGQKRDFRAMPSSQQNYYAGATPEQRASMIANLATQYGTDPTDFAFTEAAGRVVEGQSQHNAGRAAAMAEVEAVQYQQRETQVRQTIYDFAEAKDEAGKPLRPDFAQHEQKMAELANADIAAGKTPTVDDLYHRASGASA